MSMTAVRTLGDLVAARGRHVAVAAGQTLFWQGDISSTVYACVRGRVKVFVTTPNGRDVLLGIRQPGQAFGELSAIDGRPRSASVAAMEAGVVAKLSADEVLDELRSAPELALSVLVELSDQLRRANAWISARNAESITVRVGHLLLELAGQFARHGPVTAHIELPISQDELAGWIGATREATARALAGFRKAGLIETGRCRIVVADLDALANAVRTA